MTVAIVYGFAEGSYHSHKLRQSLAVAGYKVIKDAEQANIIIAHSGGCYLVPSSARAHTVINVGYTYWPGRSLVRSVRDLLRYERKQYGLLRWLWRCFVHDLYIVHIVHTARLVPGWFDPVHRLDKLIRTRQIFVRGSDDPYCEPTQLARFTYAQYGYISIPDAGHNDLWDNPQRYVDLLQSLTI